MRIDSATGQSAALTGSFTGSFIGDGTNLTGVAATSFNLDSLDALGGATIDQADNLLFSDAGTEKKVTFSNFEDTIFGNVSGDGTIAAGGALTLADGNSTRTNLGLAIGSDVQAYDAQLADVAGLAVTDGGFIVGDGSNFVLETGATVRTSLGLGTGDSPTFTGLTLSGNLTVNGTTTTVNSNTLDIGDNIIALNGVGSTLGGIAVNDGPASGSLLWNGTDNRWVAGATGSESAVLTALGYGVISGSSIASPGQGEVALTTNGVAAATVDLGLQTTDNVTFNKVIATTHVSASSYSGSSYLGGIFGNADNDEYFDFQTDAQVDLKIDNVVDFRFLDGGTFHANSDIIAYSSTIASDERLKENITDTEHGLETVLKLEAKEFDWIEKNGGKHDIGFIAQQVQEVLPVLVKEVEGLNGEDAHLTVNYTQLIPVLVNAIKELNAKVEELSK